MTKTITFEEIGLAAGFKVKAADKKTAKKILVAYLKHALKGDGKLVKGHEVLIMDNGETIATTV